MLHCYESRRKVGRRRNEISDEILSSSTKGPKKPRARDLGIPFDGQPGRNNAITDVQGVEVGFSTIIKGDSIRTGVTAVFPRGKEKALQGLPCFANYFSLNGAGEMTGIHWLTESGLLTTPILLSNTHSVGLCRDAMVKWFLSKNNQLASPVNIEDISLPIVAETWDGYLNDIDGFHVREDHVFEALNSAQGSETPVEEGNVGGGTGMVSFNFKAGTGSSSRLVEGFNYTVGVLVQSNFGRKKQLIVAGVPVGKEYNIARTSTPDKDSGSIIAIVATDAPLLPQQLKRLATRVSLGIGKLGGIGGDSSGDLFLAFSTAHMSTISSAIQSSTFLLNQQMNPLFEATIQCVEEAVINAMIAAETMQGYKNTTVEAISHPQLIEILRKYNRWNEPHGSQLI